LNAVEAMPESKFNFSPESWNIAACRRSVSERLHRRLRLAAFAGVHTLDHYEGWWWGICG
jgi:hypothetical protein